jgi:hypothetical protein
MTPLLLGQVLGFPPVYGGGGKGGSTEALQEGGVIPAGIAATVSDKPTGISPDPQKNHHPAQSVKLHPACHPRACATTILGQPRRRTVIIGTRPRGRTMGQQGREQHHDSRAGGNCLHRAPRGSRPDATTRTQQAQTGPRSPRRHAAASRPRCRRHPETAAAPCPRIKVAELIF